MEPTSVASREQQAPRNVRRELSQLLGLCEHVAGELRLLRREIDASLARTLVEAIEEHLDSSIPDEMDRTTQAIDRALSSLHTALEEIQANMRVPRNEVQPEGMPALPPRLARFLAERQTIKGFHYEVRQDPIRGWVVLWKEYGAEGTLRGAGQFYERPYAWMEE